MTGAEHLLPKLKSFILCDQAIRDIAGKYTLVGIFSIISVAEVPSYHVRMGFFLKIGGMRGRYSLEVRFVDAIEGVLGRVLLKELQHDNPLVDFESGVNIPGLSIRREGVIEVEILINSKLIHVEALRVVKMKPPENMHELKEQGE